MKIVFYTGIANNLVFFIAQIIWKPLKNMRYFADYKFNYTPP